MSFFIDKLDWKTNRSYLPLILLLTSGVSGFWWGKYPSMAEAESRCKEWEAKGRLLSYQRLLNSREIKIQFKKQYRKPIDKRPANTKKTNIKQNIPNLNALYSGSPPSLDPSLFDYDDEARALNAYQLANKDKTWDKINARSCKLEHETKQYLGYENNSIKNGTYKDESGMRSMQKVVKHFRF